MKKLGERTASETEAAGLRRRFSIQCPQPDHFEEHGSCAGPAAGSPPAPVLTLKGLLPASLTLTSRQRLTVPYGYLGPRPHTDFGWE